MTLLFQKWKYNLLWIAGLWLDTDSRKKLEMKWMQRKIRKHLHLFN